MTLVNKFTITMTEDKITSISGTPAKAFVLITKPLYNMLIYIYNKYVIKHMYELPKQCQ